MTQKRPADRPLDSEAALHQLDNLLQIGSQEVTSKISRQLRLADGDGEELEDFGPPPRLPQVQYETKSLDWNGWFKDPVAKYHLLTQNQKLLLAGGVLLFCGCLLLLVSSGKPEGNGSTRTNIAEAPASEEDAAFAEESNASEDVDNGIPQNTSTPSSNAVTPDDRPEIDEVPTASPETEKSILIHDANCLVFVTALPGFRVTGIDGYEPTAENPSLWKLAPGNYVVRFIENSSENREKSFTRTILIDSDDQFEHVVVGQELPLVINAPSSSASKPVAAIDFRVDIPFDFLSSRNIDAAEEQRLRSVINRLIDRAPLTLTDRRATPVKLAALEKERRRDPRISFLLALDAYLLSNSEAAIALCNESIAVVEMEQLPFQLPYHLLSHIYAKQRGRTGEMLALSLRALNHAEDLIETGKHGAIAGMLGEELWFYGHVLQHVSDQTQITALDLNYWQRKGLELEARYRLLDNPIQQGRDDYLTNPLSQVRSPLRLDPALLAERVRQTLPQPALREPNLGKTASR